MTRKRKGPPEAQGSDDVDLRFLLMVDATSEDEVKNTLRTVFPDVPWRKSHSFDVKGNWAEVWLNDLHDPIKARDPKSGFVFYRYRVEFSPIGTPPTMDGQVALATKIRDAFRATSTPVTVCSNFEDRL